MHKIFQYSDDDMIGKFEGSLVLFHRHFQKWERAKSLKNAIGIEKSYLIQLKERIYPRGPNFRSEVG